MEPLLVNLQPKMIKREIDLFLTAMMFYTILPVGKNRPFSQEMLGKSTRYYPLTGLIVGGLAGAMFWLASFVFPVQIAVVLCMVVSAFVTRAFHEDGLADFCDGFGGGYSKDRILAIMKDSCIGTYGSTALILMMLLKFFSISSIHVDEIPFVLVAANLFSRVLPVVVIHTLKYARTDASSKIGAIGKKGSNTSFIISLLFGSIGLMFSSWKAMIIIIPFLALLFLIFTAYIKRKIGGYTGDVLGALQQLGEMGFYLGILFSYRV